MVEVPTAQGPVLMPVEIRRNRRARYIRVWIGAEHQAVLSIPWNVKFEDALDFLKSQGDWLVDQLETQPPRISLLELLRKQRFLSADGHAWPIQFTFNTGNTRLSWNRRRPVIELAVNPHAETEAALVKAVRQFARDVLTERTLRLARQLRLPRPKVVVRDQVSRWGSCSSSGQVSLNWRLVLLRPALQDYVIYHELAHVTEMNHSDSFWTLLKTYDARARFHDRQLSRVSKKLIQVGRI